MFEQYSVSKTLLRTLAALAVLSALAACSNDEGSATDQRSGRFLDAAVQGLGFTTDTGSGLTDIDGTFTYTSGESVEFAIGELALPSVAAGEIMTALNLFNTENPADISVVNFNRLLQSLDADGNPENGIDLTQLDVSATTGLVVDFAAEDFDSQVVNLVANSGSVTTELVSPADAMAHFEMTLNENGLGATGCGSDHPLVGATAEFTTRFHDVVGTVTVVDNCTIQVSEFGYDGLGPQVYFYLGLDGNFNGPDARIIGEQLNGTVFVNDEIRLNLPGNVSLDDYNSLSVWCADFSISFGDVVLTPPSP